MIACALAQPLTKHHPAALTIKADPPGTPPIVGYHVPDGPQRLEMYSCVHCFFDITQALRAEGYVNIRATATAPHV